MKFKILHEDYLLETIADSRKFYPEISDEDFNKIIRLDPTFKEEKDRLGSYGKWLLTLFKKGKITNDNIGHVSDLITRFDSEKNNLINKDIMTYKSIEDVENALNNNASYKQQSKRQELRKVQKSVRMADTDADIVYEDDNWIIYVPHSYEASCKLGQGSHWCTASTSTDTYFNRYSKQGNLYIIKDKHVPMEMYQFHFESGSFMDRNDYSIDLNKFFAANPSIADFFLQEAKPTDETENWIIYDLSKQKKIENKQSYYIKLGNHIGNIDSRNNYVLVKKGQSSSYVELRLTEKEERVSTHNYNESDGIFESQYTPFLFVENLDLREYFKDELYTELLNSHTGIYRIKPLRVDYKELFKEQDNLSNGFIESLLSGEKEDWFKDTIKNIFLPFYFKARDGIREGNKKKSIDISKENLDLIQSKFGLDSKGINDTVFVYDRFKENRLKDIFADAIYESLDKDKMKEEIDKVKVIINKIKNVSPNIEVKFYPSYMLLRLKPEYLKNKDAIVNNYFDRPDDFKVIENIMYNDREKVFRYYFNLYDVRVDNIIENFDRNEFNRVLNSKLKEN